ncbi:uncharacterized protein KD926_002765 [Aspergillus affinis]|uniref:uncharacterized protein n=1 Tax=Aspergillus affinis TaxID=1070780 RepID=UPI0022FDE2A8|nr:uncharacterized protein KD926_002765 [Aspergillus affinis]KAI9043874.1 hypothetical protein KD926_002765 [Aspergillus affinis]
MNHLNLIIALMAILMMTVATPITQHGEIQDFDLPQDAPGVDVEEPIDKRRKCPNGWAFCGRCNGTSCKIAGVN